MDKWDRLALVFAILAFGAGGETLRLFSAEDERGMAYMGAIFTAACFIAALWFFLKKKQ